MIDEAEVGATLRWALSSLERQESSGNAEGPYQVQYDLQDLMQDQVGIVRNEADLSSAVDKIPSYHADVLRSASSDGGKRRVWVVPAR